GLRLSWPRPNDARRAVVSESALSSPSLSVAGTISDARFVHTSSWDIELYYTLKSSAPRRKLPLLSGPTFWNPYKLEGLDLDLLQYFCCEASVSPATFGHDSAALGNTLV
ncbi:hypothetical protein LY78DRAFT_535565, partial [Colletotrichum sublineola]